MLEIEYKNENNLNDNKMKLQRNFFAIVLIIACFNSFSQINVTTNFHILGNVPIDTRMVVSDVTARDAINSMFRYEGLTVYVISTATNYQLVGGISNPNWQALSLSGYTAGTGITLSGNTFSHTPHSGDATGTGTLTVVGLQGRSIATTIPTSGNVLGWNGSNWLPTSTGLLPSGTEIITATVTMNLPNIASNSSYLESFVVANASVGSAVYVSPQIALDDGLGISYSRVRATDTVEVKFRNTSAGAINPVNMDFYFMIIR
jgi:hypothetical protein